MKEFFGFGGYTRPIEGFFSWQHLVFVTFLMAVMVTLAILFGRRYRPKSADENNKPLMIAAIFIDALEIFKIVLICIRGKDAMAWLYMLPLFLCSIQLITIPLAAFSHGRLKEVALDFVFIFGLLGALLGTYGAGNNYGAYPVLSFDNVVSGITHAISGFAALYIGISGMVSMKKKNLPCSFAILASFCLTAYVVNRVIDYNYMFLMRGDDTPYNVLFDLVGGNPILYPIGVVILFLFYISIFYGVFYLLQKRKKRNSAA